MLHDADTKKAYYAHLAQAYSKKLERLQAELLGTTDLQSRAALEMQIRETQGQLELARNGALNPEKRAGLDHLAAVINESAADGEGVGNGKITEIERKGELGAFLGVREGPLRDRYAHYTMVRGYAKDVPQGIDQIWRNERGDFLIVEAKGGSSHLAKTKKGRQMSGTWLRAKADSMQRRGDPVGAEIQRALADPNLKVEGVILAQRNEQDGARIVYPQKGITGLDLSGVINYK